MRLKTRSQRRHDQTSTKDDADGPFRSSPSSSANTPTRLGDASKGRRSLRRRRPTILEDAAELGIDLIPFGANHDIAMAVSLPANSRLLHLDEDEEREEVPDRAARSAKAAAVVAAGTTRSRNVARSMRSQAKTYASWRQRLSCGAASCVGRGEAVCGEDDYYYRYHYYGDNELVQNLTDTSWAEDYVSLFDEDDDSYSDSSSLNGQSDLRCGR